MNMPSSGSSYVSWLPAPPATLCSLQAPALHPLCMWCLLSNPPALLLSPPAVASRCSHSPEPKHVCLCFKASHCWSFADFQKAGWPVTQASDLSLPCTLFSPICRIFLWISVVWKRKHQLVFFPFTLFNITGIISPPFYLRFSFFGTIQCSFLLSNKLLLRDARHICPGDSWLSLT